jgi:hypothetical protein
VNWFRADDAWARIAVILTLILLFLYLVIALGMLAVTFVVESGVGPLGAAFAILLWPVLSILVVVSGFGSIYAVFFYFKSRRAELAGVLFALSIAPWILFLWGEVEFAQIEKKRENPTQDQPQIDPLGDVRFLRLDFQTPHTQGGPTRSSVVTGQPL